MKKHMRTIAFFLAILMVIPLFSACKNSKETVVLELDGHEITEGMYSYWMHTLKEYYLNRYSDVTDDPEYWAQENQTGMTNGEYLEKRIKTNINFYLIGMVLFDELDLSLSDETKTAINDAINDQIAHYESRSAYAKALKEEYGMTVSDIKAAFTAEEEYLKVCEYLYDDINGKETASSQELEEYYQENYVRVKYVMFLKNVKYVYNDDGTRQTDSTGRYLTKELTEEEKEKVTENAQNVYTEALGGKDMNELMETYMKEFGFDLSTTPNGFYISANDYVTHTATVTSAALEMEEDEIRFCEDDDCYYVVKKFNLPEKGYTSTTDSGQFKNLVSYVNNKKLEAKFSELAEGIKENTEITKSYKLSEL